MLARRNAFTKKMIRESDVADVHIAPHTFRVAAMFTILTRLKDPKTPRYRFNQKNASV
ncbi:hypothetical protein GCM10020331_088670 [Ectobacillus funiculus]